MNYPRIFVYIGTLGTGQTQGKRQAKSIPQANVNILFGTSAYGLGSLRIIRARIPYEETASQSSRSSTAEKEEKLAYYAALVALPSEGRKEMEVLLTGPTYIGTLKAVEVPKKGGPLSFAASSTKHVGNRYAGSPEAAKSSAIPGLVDVIEEKIHEKILALGRVQSKQ